MNSPVTERSLDHSKCRERRSRFLFMALLAFIALALSIPLLTILGSFFQFDAVVWRHLWSTVLGDYVKNSLLLMLGVGTLSLLWGVSAAWFVTMYRFPFSRFISRALFLPLAMPAYIIAYSYTGMLDVGGTLHVWLGMDAIDPIMLPRIRSLWGAIILMSFVLYPYVYLLARVAFLEQSPCMLEIARTLGYGSLGTFLHVALPLARPAITVGLSLALMETLADYGTVQYFGLSVFTTGIFRTWFGLGEEWVAAQLSSVLLLFVFALLALERLSRRRQRFFQNSVYHSATHTRILRGWKAWGVMGACLLPVLFGFVIPVAHLFWLLLDSEMGLFDASFFELALHSMYLAFGASLLTLMVAVFVIYGHRHVRLPASAFIQRFVGMGYALPGAVIAVGVMIPFAWLDRAINDYASQWFGWKEPGLLFSGTLFALLFAYVLRYLAIPLGAVDAALQRIKPNIEEAARMAGESLGGIVRRVHVPLMSGSLVTALLLVFVDVLKELPATLILRPFDFNTLAVRAWELANQERLAEAAAPALAIVFVGIIPTMLLSLKIARLRLDATNIYRTGADGHD
ncbi:MAG: ABC transporter permease [Candidatus Eutrophobiaceae bacterium]